MGTYRAFRTEVMSHDMVEREALIKEIKADEELNASLDKWDKNIKGWCPDEKLEALTQKYKNSYVLVTVAEEACEAYQHLFYRGVGMNAECATLRRMPPLHAVKKVRKRLLIREAANAAP